MKRLLSILAAMAASIAAFAFEPAIRDIRIDMTLSGSDGSARVHERWDITASAGTEWYLVRDNLGDMRISDLRVVENGREFINEGAWNSGRTIAEKAGRCGIVNKGGGVELCWGLGSMGDHVFDVYYTMSNVVKSADDYDFLHLQLVSPQLSSRPEHIGVTIRSDSGAISEANTRLWGFGFNGTSGFGGGAAAFKSEGRFRSGSSVIVLMRFDKGMFESGSIRKGSFGQVLDRAMEGASFSDDDPDDGLWAALVYLAFCAVFMLALAAGVRASRRNVVGMKPGKVPWWRDVPYGGDLARTAHTLGRLGEIRKQNTMASALILRMIHNGQLLVAKDADDRIEISFSDDPAALESLSPEARGLYDMMKEASGADRILQDREFSRWGARHNSRIRKWAELYERRGRTALTADGDIQGGKYTPQGQEKAREALGFKKFLDDFTLMKEKGVIEAGMWREYLVFGALFGIADKVARELKDIDTGVFAESGGMDYLTTYRIVRMTDAMSRAITNARASGGGGGSRSGFGGVTSFGGGGGFSGGGFGGGAR